MDISLSLLQPQPKMERTAFRAWNHWTSLSPLFLPFALARLSSSVEPKAKMERNTDNTLVLDKGSKRTRTISLPFNSEQVQVNQEERRLPGEGNHFKKQLHGQNWNRTPIVSSSGI